MTPAIEAFRWIGVTIACILLILSVRTIRQSHLGPHASLSLHMAATKKEYLKFGLFLTIGGALFYSFIAFWIVPTYALDTSVFGLLGLAYIAQLGIAWLPENSKNVHVAGLHRACGVILGSAMILLLTQLSLNAASLGVVSSYLIPIITVSTYAAVIAYLSFSRLRRAFLIFEMSFIALFCIAMVLLALQL